MLLLTWWITFTIVAFTVVVLGFNPVGIDADMTFVTSQTMLYVRVLLRRKADPYASGILGFTVQGLE